MDETTQTPGDVEIEVDLFDDEDTTESEQTEQVEESKPEETETVEEEAEPQEETEESAEVEETEEKEESTSDDDEALRKHNAEMAQRRIAEREARRQAEQQRLEQQNQYLKEAESDEDFRLRQLEVERANAAAREYERVVETNRNNVIGDYERILSDPTLEMFNSKSDGFNKRQFERMQRSFEAENVSVDPRNPDNILEVRESFYKFAKDWADDWKLDAKVNQAKGQKVATRNLAKAEPPSSSAGKIPVKKDPLEELWSD